jgi:hypothetical protein
LASDKGKELVGGKGTSVVNNGLFLKAFPCNHIINVKNIFSFSGKVKDSVIFPFLYILHKLHKSMLPPCPLSPPTVNSGIVHPTAVLICPFIAATTGANGGFGDFQWKSPFDTRPATLAPLSLINLQVAVGGQNVLHSTLNMTYENFLQQTN